MGKNKDKLHYVKGVCELEKGEVFFEGGMWGVSSNQVWYYIIYAIKDKFSEIDFWINPELSKCETLPSTENYKRYGICKQFICSYKEFPNGEVRPKMKLSSLEKKKYDENRAKVDLGIPVINANDIDLNIEGDMHYFRIVEDSNEVDILQGEINDSLNINTPINKEQSKCNNYKNELLECCTKFDILADKVINSNISMNDIYEVTDEVYSSTRAYKELFKNNLVRAKFDLSEIDFYDLCNYIDIQGSVILNDISNKLDISSDTFLALCDIHCRLNELLLFIEDTLANMKDLATDIHLKNRNVI